MKKFLFDLFPLLLFFGAYKYSGDMYVATGVAIAASIGQIIWLRLRRLKIEHTHWINLGVIVLFGGATIIFKNDAFIRWKPTVLYWIFGVALLSSRWLFNRNLMQKLLGSQVALPAPVWDKMNYSWALFFILAGAANLYVAFSGYYTETQWVNFKVFGLTALLVVFVIAQSIWLGRHLKDSRHQAANDDQPPLS